MNTPITIIPIRQVATTPQPTPADAHPPASRSCGACLHSAAGPVCHIERPASAGAGPQLIGPPQQLEQLLQALHQALVLVEHAAHSTETGAAAETQPLAVRDFIHRLSLVEGEAELVLGVAPRCGGAQLADAAFQTLRRLLPDTDIYVSHAA